MKNRIELLAPAGYGNAQGRRSGRGECRIYLAGTRFGARQSAENFTQETLRKPSLIAIYGVVRVYAANEYLDSKLEK